MKETDGGARNDYCLSNKGSSFDVEIEVWIRRRRIRVDGAGNVRVDVPAIFCICSDSVHTEAFVQSEDRAWEERKAMATGETKRREVREGGINLILNINFFCCRHISLTNNIDVCW